MALSRPMTVGTITNRDRFVSRCTDGDESGRDGDRVTKVIVLHAIRSCKLGLFACCDVEEVRCSRIARIEGAERIVGIRKLLSIHVATDKPIILFPCTNDDMGRRDGD